MTGLPAQAATCPVDTACPTTVTFDIAAGALEITVPDTADLANDGAPGGFAYGPLGAVTVDDNRASATPAWTVAVTSTDFVTAGGDDPGETIVNDSVYYCSGAATATTGDGTFTPGQTGCAAPPPPTGQTLDIERTAFAHAGGTGVNSATWNPLITIALALSNVAGQYTGTISHTVT
ncbi:hypothetical protein [Sphaerisporangium sp. TRM90804]|uniref:hypothetical protein n=1 Tax=Sphaerisporangium sp. TRM90804 TaxID=3031113 RepID=UPI00244C647A|nr:hypothetical protein [Sphaerisporangium sp. TRM90804]MDH2425653.1 hypothetical protein [Sphaerisporangium sp. TRM90804]